MKLRELLTEVTQQMFDDGVANVEKILKTVKMKGLDDKTGKQAKEAFRISRGELQLNIRKGVNIRNASKLDNSKAEAVKKKYKKELEEIKTYIIKNK